MKPVAASIRHIHSVSIIFHRVQQECLIGLIAFKAGNWDGKLPAVQTCSGTKTVSLGHSKQQGKDYLHMSRSKIDSERDFTISDCALLRFTADRWTSEGRKVPQGRKDEKRIAPARA